MSIDFKAKAKEYVNQATEEDNASNYTKAFPLYMNSVEYFMAHLKYENDFEARDSIDLEITNYLRRAEELHAILNDDTKLGTCPTDDLIMINSKEHAFEVAKQAVEEDNAGNYPKAFALYVSVSEYFKGYMKHEKMSEVGDIVSWKLNDCTRRAGEIRAVVDYGGGPRGIRTCNSRNLNIVIKFRDDAIGYVKEAVWEDNARNYSKAFLLYMNALEYFRTYLRYETNHKIREKVIVKFSLYLRRAEEIRAIIDGGREASGSSQDGGHGDGGRHH